MIFTDSPRRHLIRQQYAIAGAMFLMAFTPLQYSGVQWFYGAFYCVAGRLYWLSSSWWVLLILYSHYLLTKAYRPSPTLKKTQIKFFFVAMAFGFSGGVFCFLPPLGVDLYPWGNFSICLYPIIMSYAIVKHRLMDISVIIRKTLVYSSVTGVLVLFYLGAITLFGYLFEGLTGYQTLFSSVVTAALITFGFQPLLKRVQAFVDARFFRQYVDREEKLYELSRDVVTHTSPEAMAEALVRVLNETVHPKFVAVYFRTRIGTEFAQAAREEAADLPARIDQEEPLIHYLMGHPQPFVQEPSAASGMSRDTRGAGGSFRV